MPRYVTGLAGLASVVTVIGLAVPGAGPASATATSAPAVRTALPDPVPSWPAEGNDTDNGPAPASTVLKIRVYLAGRDPAGEARFATAASTPGQAGYGRYLSPAQFQARFGPGRAQVTAVERWARSAGLTVTGATPHYVAVTGTAPAISTALNTSIHSYSNTQIQLTGYGPVQGISVPASLGGDVSTVTGLDDYTFASAAAASARAHLNLAPAATAAATAPAGKYACSSWWGQHVSSIPAADGMTTAPDAVCGYTPQQLRSAYGVTAGSGKGATIAIVLDGELPTMQADANRFFAAHHLPGFAPGQFVQNTGPGYGASCGSGSADAPEEPLDVETAHIIAPAAKIVYVAANCGTTSATVEADFLDAETRVADQHLGDTETESFSTIESSYTAATAAAWTQVFEQGAAEGIGFNFNSGDNGNDSAGPGTPTAVNFPASDPWATAVGGTALEIGQTGTVIGELGWGDNGAPENSTGTGYQQAPPGMFEEGSTGGRSDLFTQPAYQRGVVPPALATAGGTQPAVREVPDIAANASPMTGWLIGYTPPGASYAEVLEAGTSGSAPIIAALEADAKQAAGHALGFANPLLYDLRRTTGIRDIQAAATPALVLAPNCYNAAPPPTQRCVVTLGPDSSLIETPGYDDVTGVGAATSTFITTLAKAEPRCRVSRSRSASDAIPASHGVAGVR